MLQKGNNNLNVSSRGKVVLKASSLALTSALLVSGLSACSKGSESDAKQHVLRIGFMYSDSYNEQYLRQQFTDGYELLHPNVDIEIVSAMQTQNYAEPDPNKKQPDPYENMKEMLNGSNPVDVVIVDSPYFRKLIQDNMLTKLDTLIQDNKFDIEDFVPSVIDGIKEAGEGSIYGLTPTFNASALFYNKKLFADQGVEVPKDGMQWSDVFTLAQRVAKGDGKERKFGLAINRWSDPYSDMMTYSAPLQLRMFDKNAEKMTVNTAQWKKVWTDISNLYQQKLVPTQEDYNMTNDAMNGKQVYNPFQGDLFISGRIAMMVAGYDYVTQLSQVKDAAAQNSKITNVDWDVVTMPTFAESPDVGGNVYLNNLMAINAKAQNSEDAWDFIAFNNGKDWAKLKSRSTYELVARKSFLKPKDGMNYNMAAFYSLKPAPGQDPAIDKLYQEKPNLYQVQQYAPQLFQEVVQKKKSVDQALQEWETKGNVLLQKIKTNPTGPLDGTDGSVGVSGGGAVVEVKPAG